MKRTNEEIYRKEINESKDYKTTKEKFKKWLKENEYERQFKRDCKEMIENPDMDIYDIAVDYSIPIILLKALLADMK